MVELRTTVALASGNDDALDRLLKKMKNNSTTTQFLPDELTSLINAFSPAHIESYRSKAYLVLSTFCQEVRRGDAGNAATETITRIFGPPCFLLFSETREISLLVSTSFLAAFFQVDYQAASSIFIQDGALENIMDSVELEPSIRLSYCVAHLLGQACGHKICRTTLSPQAIQWLKTKVRSTNASLRAASAVALIKLSKGTTSDAVQNQEPDPETEGEDENVLAEMMKTLISNEDQQDAVVDAVEGLAYLSINSSVKEMLSKDQAFLKRLFDSVPLRTTAPIANSHSASTLVYGILMIISNICAYRPRLNEEQTQIQKLRRLAKTGKNRTQQDDSLDDDDKVRARIRHCLDAGVLAVFPAAISGNDSPGIRVNVGTTLLHVIEDKENRGRVLQSGGSKVLRTLIARLLSTKANSSTGLDPTDLSPIQALAKLAITASPIQVFGPNVGVLYDAVRPFSLLLQHPSSTLLQIFEAMMALTNLASFSAELASRIASADGLLNRVELLLLEDHILVRRAAMELVCNLILGSDEVFNRYGGNANSTSTRTKLQVILALSDVDDLPTRLAAAGALATLTSAVSVCQGLKTLQLEKQRVLTLLTLLIDPSCVILEDRALGDDNVAIPGLVHRGVICVYNILKNLDQNDQNIFSLKAKEVGLVQALANILKNSRDEVVVQPAAESLKMLIK